ncbi:TonB-dependent siderophore receptor [Verrucomicrobiaceae bacterium 227]
MKFNTPLSTYGCATLICGPWAGSLSAQVTASTSSVELLDEIVVTANGRSDPKINPGLAKTSKLGTPIFETPRAVETVTREEFVERGARNLEETLNYTAGVQSGYYGLDTRQDFIRVRGLNSTNYKDGLQHQFNFYNNTPQEAYGVEQIDVIKGPASLLFGRGTVGGTVNTSSKIAGANLDNEIMLGGGTDSRYEAGLDFNQALNQDETLFFRLVSYYRESETYIDHVSDDARFLMPSLTWQPSEDTSLSILLNLQENHSTPSLQFFPIEATKIAGKTLTNHTYGGEPGIDRYDTKQTSVNVLFNHKFNERYSLSANARYVHSSADYVEHTLVPPGIGSLIGALPEGNYHRILYAADHTTDVFSGNAILTAKYDIGAVAHTLQLGTDYTYAERERHTLPPNAALFGVPYTYAGFIDLFNPAYGNFLTTIPELSDYLAIEEQQVGLFLHDQIKWDNFIVSLGTRYDDYQLKSNKTATDSQENWSFDAGLMYQFDNGVSPYYSYAESFEPQGINQFTNAPLKPKSGTQHEVGVKWMPSENTLVTASYFQVEEENRTINTGTSVTQSSSVEVNGAELAIRHRYRDLHFQASYTYLDTANNDLTGSPQLPGVPEQQASAWITYRPESGPLDDFRAGIGARFNGSSGDGRDQISTSSHTLIDAMVGYRWKDLDIQLNVTNLFDRQYVQSREFSPSFNATNAFLGQDRAINLSATLTF